MDSMTGEETDSPQAQRLYGRVGFADLVAETAHMTLAVFVQRNSQPFLAQLTESGTNQDPALRVGFQTLARNELTKEPMKAPFPLYAYRVRKRPGANTFGFITVGRARNNDIVIQDGLVSKFHASLSCDKNGWTISDSSKNGTWLDGELLPPGKPRPLPYLTVVNLGKAIVVALMKPEHIFQELVKARSL